MARTSDIGNAGEHLVMAELLAQGFLAFWADRGNAAFDAAVITPTRHALLRVKTTTKGNLRWSYKGKDRFFLEVREKDDFVVIVDLSVAQPTRARAASIYIVPTQRVDEEIRKVRAHWLSHPRRDGGERKDAPGLSLKGRDTPGNIGYGYAEKWREYREAWGLLRDQ